MSSPPLAVWRSFAVCFLVLSDQQLVTLSEKKMSLGSKLPSLLRKLYRRRGCGEAILKGSRPTFIPKSLNGDHKLRLGDFVGEEKVSNACYHWAIMAFRFTILLSLLAFLTQGWSSPPGYSGFLPPSSQRADTYPLTEKSTYYPDLLEAGVEQLVAGLESGAWTSVDLTKVRSMIFKESFGVDRLRPTS
jgi:hypothetical protein